MQVEVGAVVEGTVTGITKFGAFVSLPDGRSGLVHISEIANTYVNDVNEFLKLGDKVKVRVLAVTPDGKINLSIKKAEEAPARPNNRPMHGGRPGGSRPNNNGRAPRARTTVRPSRRDRSAARAGTLRLKTGSSSSCRSRTAAWPATASTATARAAAAAAAAADKTKDGIRPHCVCSGAFFRRKEPIMQVYLSEHIAPSAYARLARHFEIVDNFDHPEQLAAMIIRRAVVPRAVIAHTPNLKVIAMHGVSRDTIDTAAAAEFGVPVPNVPGLGAPAVAELAVADLLALNRQLKFVNNGLCAGRFDHFGAEEFVCHEMTGRTLGLVGTGNIAGVTGAIILGGPGAVFWMWVISFFGMATIYAEATLAQETRIVEKDGNVKGGPVYYITTAFKGGFGKFLAGFFAIAITLALGFFGCMVQSNSIGECFQTAFGIPSWIVGIVLVIICAIIFLGGVQRLAAVTEKLVPLMALFYIAGAFIIVVMHAGNIPAALAAIFRGAFNLNAAGGGALGYGISQTITWGFKRGAFSNEAGLGSAVMVNSASNVKEPVHQGMWGVFEVFADTIVVCTLTALVILTTGVVDLQSGAVLANVQDNALVGQAFTAAFGSLGPKFIAISILLFAYSTTLGWSHYGTKAVEYLFGTTGSRIYKVVFVGMTVVGSTMKLGLAWDLSDTFNGLMMIPNLLAVLALSGTVVQITKNYLDRKVNGKDIPPMWSAFAEYQKAEEAEAAEEAKQAREAEALAELEILGGHAVNE